MGARRPRYSKEEIAQRGQEIYEKRVRPLVGMRLLRDHNLSVDVVEGGNVRIETLT